MSRNTDDLDGRVGWEDERGRAARCGKDATTVSSVMHACGLMWTPRVAETVLDKMR